jgi:hypothetical protein
VWIFLPLQMRLSFNHQEATQCIPMHEQEGSRQRGTAVVDDAAAMADGGMTELATASVCGSAAAGRG